MTPGPETKKQERVTITPSFTLSSFFFFLDPNGVGVAFFQVNFTFSFLIKLIN